MRLMILAIALAALLACGAEMVTEEEANQGIGTEAARALTEVPTATPTPTPTLAPTRTSTPAPTTSPLSTFEELLGTIPDFPETRQWVTINDYTLVRKLFDLALPERPSDEMTPEQYRIALQSTSQYIEDMLSPSTSLELAPFISGYSHNFERYLDRYLYLAFDVQNVEQSVATGSVPNLEVIRGRFDVGATRQALEACTECADADRKAHSGISFYSWGEDYVADFELAFSPPAYDFLGRGSRIGVIDDFVFRTVDTLAMEAMIDAYLGNRDSLADIEEFRLLAQGLDDLQVYSAILTDLNQPVGDQIEPWLSLDATQADWDRMVELRETFPVLRPYQAFATAVGRDETGPFIALVIVHRDTCQAEDNVELLRRRLEEAPSLPSWEEEQTMGNVHVEEIWQGGRTVLAKLRGDVTEQAWSRWLWWAYPLLPHE